MYVLERSYAMAMLSSSVGAGGAHGSASGPASRIDHRRDLMTSRVYFRGGNPGIPSRLPSAQAHASRSDAGSQVMQGRRCSVRSLVSAASVTNRSEDAKTSRNPERIQSLAPAPEATTFLTPRASTKNDASAPHRGAGPAPGSPLSPATARALARGFRAGDLALASAEPLQVWCGRRTRGAATGVQPPPQQQREQGQPASDVPGFQGQLVELPSRSSQTGVATGSYSTVVARGTVPAGSGAGGQHRGPGSAGSSGGVGATGGGAGGDGDVDVLLVGPAGMPRDLSVAVAAVEKLLLRPAGRGCIGCVVLAPSRERAEALQEATFTLLSERAGGSDSMHVMSAHGGTRFRDDVSGLRSQPPDVLVATPGRLTQLLTSQEARLGHLFESLRVLALDGGEALAEPEFRAQVERLLRLLPNTSLSGPAAVAGRGAARRRPAAGSAATAPPPPSPPSPRAVTIVAAAGNATATAGAGAGLRSPSTYPVVSVGALDLELQGPAAWCETTHGGGSASPGEEEPRGGAGGAPPQGLLLPPHLIALAAMALRPGYAVVQLGSGHPLYDADVVGGGKDDLYDLFGNGLARNLATAVTAALGGGTATRGQSREQPSADPPLALKALSEATSGFASALSRHAVSGAPPPSPSLSLMSTLEAAVEAAAAAASPLVPLYIFAVPYEEHLSYLYVILRQHMLSEGRHKIVVQFPSASLAALYAGLFQALGFPVAEAHSRKAQAARQAAVRDFAAGPRGLLFGTDLGGAAGLDGRSDLTLVVWVGLPRSPQLVVQQIAAIQHAAAASTASAVAISAGAAAPPQFQPDAAAATIGGGASMSAQRGAAGAAASRSSPASGPPRCLLVLNDVEQPGAVAAVAAEAMSAAGLGPVIPTQRGAWAGPLDAVQRRVEQALSKVPPATKLKGLEGMLGHLWAARSAGGGAGGGRGHGGVSTRCWGAAAGGQVLHPEQLGIWARRFAGVMGMPQPPLLRRLAASRMGLRSIPGVALVDTQPRTKSSLPPPPQLLQADPWVMPQVPRRRLSQSAGPDGME